MNKNRDKKGRFIKGHKINIGRKHDFVPHIIKNLESFKKMRSEKMKGNKINLGRKWPEEVKRKISEVKKGTYTGEENSNWKGGIYSNIRKYMREYLKTYMKEYRKKNLERIREWRRRYRKLHLEDYKKSYKKWRKLNLEKCNLLSKRYRARKEGAKGFHTLEEWELLKKQYNYKCLACGRRKPKIKLEEDHIIPLSKGGSDYIENIQPLCRSCNAIKGIKNELQVYKGRTGSSVVSN